jgi:hypothetical protein
VTAFDTAEGEVTELLKRRLGLDDPTARDLAGRFLIAVLDQALVNVRSQTVGPSNLAAVRVQQVELLAHRLGRLPSVRELAALLRITESTARTTLRNVLAISDRANDVALMSVFDRATSAGSVGGKGDPPNGSIWELASKADLDLAREQLEIRRVAFATKTEGDGKYVLVVDRSFDPSKLGR